MVLDKKRIAYLIYANKNPGGMERVLSNKVNYLAALPNYEVYIITTDQDNRPPFFEISNNVLQIDLNINYFENKNRLFIFKFLIFINKQVKHRKRLKNILKKNNIDITISMYGNETMFLPSLKDGSKKFFELHFSMNYRKIMDTLLGHNVLHRISTKYRRYREIKAINKYDEFTVLTHEDKKQWETVIHRPINVIPNFISHNTERISNVSSKVVVAIGHLDVVKGFNRLIEAWQKIADEHKDWQLHIYGDGPLKQSLNQQIIDYNCENNIKILPPTHDIESIYYNSSIFVLSSYSEGFPMVLLEAMDAGLAVVAYNCKCGPSDMIVNGYSGLLVEEGNILKLSEAISKLIKDTSLRILLGNNARMSVRENFNRDIIMQNWIKLFEK